MNNKIETEDDLSNHHMKINNAILNVINLMRECGIESLEKDAPDISFRIEIKEIEEKDYQ